MTLQNKVVPNGDILAVLMRGQMMGNRGGRIHDHREKVLHPTRRWASRQWICCVTSFNNRHREVMGKGYTELFFLDEVTAFSAGHRPCFECRRREANKFAECWAEACNLEAPPRAGEMDRVLHTQRLDGRSKRSFQTTPQKLPTGAMVAIDRNYFAVFNDKLRPWSPNGYGTEINMPKQVVEVLTPPAIIDVLRAGFQPLWHGKHQ